MSELMPRDILSDLWQEILKRQWHYMEAEESPQKLEERKKLEGSLKELLCRVRQDRKFFVPETAVVLNNTICQNKEFSINKAISAFEGISQYANNLYSKPWRKEFRILKMYSGFYHHEIKSSLIDAEKLFIAMGYRGLTDDTLILDGPICPDQVSNVFRDAMSAYVELQIMKNIRMGLEANEVTVTWLDIFWYREKHVGGTTQAIKDLICAAEEKRYRSSEKTALPVDNYGYIDVQHSSNFLTPSPQCQCSNPYHQPLPRQRGANNGPCCLHEMPPLTPSNMMYGNYPTHNYHNQQPNIGPDTMSHLPQMSHSRSLEHYSEPNHTILPHRHSFDHQQQGCTAAVHYPQHLAQLRLHRAMQQQQFYHNPSQNYYDPTYDSIAENSVGGSSISHAAVASVIAGAGGGRGGSGVDVGCSTGGNYNLNASTYANPYNVSGNRIPLPYNISNQLSGYENNPHTGMDPTYARVLDNHMYAQVAKTPQNYFTNYEDNGANALNPYAYSKSVENCNNDSAQRQNSYVSEHLINFDDSPIIPPPPAAHFDPYQKHYATPDPTRGKRCSKMATVAEPNVAGNYGATIGKTNINSDEAYGYAKPIPKECRQSQKNMDKSSCLRKTSYTSVERGAGDTTDLSYESINDDVRQQQHSPTQFTKNQDGVGSFESWNYVFKNLERSGYNKDLGEREDLVIKTLGLESLNIANDSTTPSQTSSGEKRKSGCKENDNPGEVKYKTKIFGPSEKGNAVAPSAGNSYTKQKPQTDNNKQKVKSALKQPVQGTAATTNNKPNTGTNKKNSNMAKANDNKPKGNNLNDNNNTRFAAKSTKSNKKSSVAASAVNSTVKSSSVSASNPAETVASEWSCQFCTLINPGKTRICEVCAHTKDFNVDDTPSVSANTTATAQSAVAHNTPTCV